MKTLIVIPAYNEEESIVNTITNLQSVNPDVDYLIINDGSKDRTLALCQENHYNHLNLSVNLGLAGGFKAGMKYALLHDYDAVLQFDADGQHQPEYIKPLCDEMSNSDVDIVIGSRFVNEKKPISARMVGSALISFAIRVTTGKSIKDPTSGMRLYNKKMIERFAHEGDFSPEPDTIALLMRKGAKVSEVQAYMKERIAGQSYLTFTKSMLYMTRVCVSIFIVQWFR